MIERSNGLAAARAASAAARERSIWSMCWSRWRCRCIRKALGPPSSESRIASGGARDHRVQLRRRIECERRDVLSVDAAPVRVQGLVGDVFGVDHGVVVGRPPAGQHLRPAHLLPPIPETHVGERRSHSPTFAEIDRQLGRRERRDEACEPLARLIVGLLEAPVRHGVSSISGFLAPRDRADALSPRSGSGTWHRTRRRDLRQCYRGFGRAAPQATPR